MYADENVIKIKHDVLYTVAKLAFEGRLEEERDHIATELIPGPTPQFRCCIYKEREIIRQRVRLAEGKAPGAEDDGNVIQVISSACEDCPISSPSSIKYGRINRLLNISTSKISFFTLTSLQFKLSCIQLIISAFLL